MSDTRLLTPEARAALDAASEGLDAVLAELAPRDAQLFRLRLERWFQNLLDGLVPVYGNRADFPDFLNRLVLLLADGHARRPDALQVLDMARDLEPDWFQHESMLGYVFYVERFAGTLAGVHERLDYLDELGANYLHLMKVIAAREGENDGGYAVVDYTRVEPALGTNADLEALCTETRRRGQSVCIDLVLNHCAREHPWARAASAGDERYRRYFHTYPDRSMPDAFEATLPEVFPDFAPGNFTWDDEGAQWVWTTFNSYQWDLNWANPEVFLEIVSVMQTLANLGVEVFRLDAVAFMWKRLGTDCQNQEEVFDLLQGLRTCSRIATPAVAHKAEAIVAPDDLIRYFGVGRHHGKVSNIAYHNSLMVQYWSALASRDTRLMTHALAEFPRTPNSIAWGTYLRCHDDIGWAIADDDAAAVGLDAFLHRAFLSDYYTGRHPGSHARGGVFQHNPDTGDRRVNGSLASLAGIELALETNDPDLLALSIERVLMGHALVCGFGGLPLVYMGDEIGLINDPDWAEDPAHRDDSRWMHRPAMDWDKAARRHDPGSVEGRLFDGLRTILAARRRTPQLRARFDTDIVDVGHPHVFTVAHRHPLGDLTGLYNFTEAAQHVRLDALRANGLAGLHDVLTEASVAPVDGHVVMVPYGRLWLT